MPEKVVPGEVLKVSLLHFVSIPSQLLVTELKSSDGFHKALLFTTQDLKNLVQEINYDFTEKDVAAVSACRIGDGPAPP